MNEMKSIKDKVSKLTYVAEFQKKLLIEDLFGCKEEDISLLLEVTVDEVFRVLFNHSLKDLDTNESVYVHNVIADMTKEFVHGE